MDSKDAKWSVTRHGNEAMLVVGEGACGGTHRLSGLTAVESLERYRHPVDKLTGGWGNA